MLLRWVMVMTSSNPMGPADEVVCVRGNGDAGHASLKVGDMHGAAGVSEAVIE